MKEPTMPIPDLLEAIENLSLYDYANFEGQSLDFLYEIDNEATMAVIQAGDALKRLKDKINEIKSLPVTDDLEAE